MDIPTSASTVITCTKSEFAFYLDKAFAPVTALSPDQFRQLSEVVDGLVRQANQYRGTFTGYNAYLDCQFTVTPDEDPRNPATIHYGLYDGKTLCGMPARALDGEHHAAVDFFDGDATCEQCNEAARERVETDQIAIPAVTDAQRDEARDSAYATAHHAVRVLRRQLDIGQLNPETFDQLGDALKAAAGHLRIATGIV